MANKSAKSKSANKEMRDTRLTLWGVGAFLFLLVFVWVFGYLNTNESKEAFAIIREPITSSVRSTTDATVTSNDAYRRFRRRYQRNSTSSTRWRAEDSCEIGVAFTKENGQKKESTMKIAGFHCGDATLAAYEIGDTINIAYFTDERSALPYPSKYNGKFEYIKSMLTGFTTLGLNDSRHGGALDVISVIIAMVFLLTLAVMSFIQGTASKIFKDSILRLICVSLLISTTIFTLLLTFITLY